MDHLPRFLSILSPARISSWRRSVGVPSQDQPLEEEYAKAVSASFGSVLVDVAVNKPTEEYLRPEVSVIIRPSHSIVGSSVPAGGKEGGF